MIEKNLFGIPTDRVLLITGLDYWTGTLDWIIGLAYFWFLHILRLLFVMSLQTKGLQGPLRLLQIMN